MTRHIISGAAIFDGMQMLHNHIVMIEDGMIAAILPGTEPLDGPHLILKGGTIAPGLIDLQVNGGGGIIDRKSVV